MLCITGPGGGGDVGYASNLPSFICTLHEVVLIYLNHVFLICTYLCLGLKLCEDRLLETFLLQHAS